MALAGGKVRESWIDGAKGFTICLVVLHHIISGLRGADALPKDFADYYALLSPVRMPLFFLVAGLFARRSIFGPLDKFINSKLIYFAYFYILWSVISISFRSSLGSYTTHDVDMTSIFYILWHPVFTLWFLHALFVGFVIARLTRNVSPVVQIAFAIAISATIKLFYNDPTNIFLRILALYPFFLVGVYASDAIRAFVARAKPFYVLIFGLAYASLAAVAFHARAVQSPLLYFPMAAAASMTIMLTMRQLQDRAVGRVFSFLGQRSLYIYLTHFLPAAGVRVIGFKLGLSDNPFVIIAAGFPFAITFCLVTYYTCSALPIAKYLFRVPDFLKIETAPANEVSLQRS